MLKTGDIIVVPNNPDIAWEITGSDKKFYYTVNVGLTEEPYETRILKRVAEKNWKKAYK